MAEKTVKAGDIIFNEGDIADAAYIVVSGVIELFSLGNVSEVKVGIMEAGKIFGELAVFKSQELRPYSARATVDGVLQGMTAEEFDGLFAKCPQPIQPFLLLAFDKFIPTKNRTKTTAAHLSKSDVAQIVITPVSDNLKAQFKPIEVPINNLPFRIGGYPEDSEKNRKDQLHLAIASLRSPLLISRQHCEITLDEKDNIVLNDLGSRFGTKVNGLIIGRGHGIYTVPLKKGNNEIFLGGGDKYKLTIACK